MTLIILIVFVFFFFFSVLWKTQQSEQKAPEGVVGRGKDGGKRGKGGGGVVRKRLTPWHPCDTADRMFAFSLVVLIVLT